MVEIIKILSHFPLPHSGTGPDGRITKKDVESFVPSKAPPVSRLEICGNGCYRNGKVLWKGSSCMELALLDCVGSGDCKVVKFNLPETLEPSPFDISPRKKKQCAPKLSLVAKSSQAEVTQSQLAQHC